MPSEKKNEYAYLSLDIICSSKLTVFTSWNRRCPRTNIRTYFRAIALYGDIKFSRGKHSANLGEHVVVKRCIVTTFYGFTVLLRGIILYCAA